MLGSWCAAATLSICFVAASISLTCALCLAYDTACNALDSRMCVAVSVRRANVACRCRRDKHILSVGTRRDASPLNARIATRYQLRSWWIYPNERHMYGRSVRNIIVFLFLIQHIPCLLPANDLHAVNGQTDQRIP